MRILTSFALLSCLACPPALHAETVEDSPRVRFSGFGTIGFAHTRGDGTAFVRDMSQPKGAANRGLNWELDSRLGVQAMINPLENLQGVAQVISRYRAENNFDPELNLGYLKYSPTEYLDLRGGRVGYDIFHAADSRDVGFSYLWIRPPLEYYGADLANYIDGGDIVFQMPVGAGISRIKLYSGLARNQVPNLAAQKQWAGNITADLGIMQDLAGTRIVGGLIDYHGNNWVLRLSQSNIRILKEIPAGPIDTLAFIRNTAMTQPDPALAGTLTALADDIAFAGKTLKFSSVGIIYEDGPLRTEGAIYHLTSNSLMFSNLTAGYWSVGYRFGKITPYATIAATKSRKSYRATELAGKGVGAAVSVAQFMLTRAEQDRQGYTAGIRYDLADNVALKFQVDFIRNKTCSPASLPLIGAAPPCTPPLLLPTVAIPWDGRATVFSTVIDFTF